MRSTNFREMVKSDQTSAGSPPVVNFVKTQMATNFNQTMMVFATLMVLMVVMTYKSPKMAFTAFAMFAMATFAMMK